MAASASWFVMEAYCWRIDCCSSVRELTSAEGRLIPSTILRIQRRLGWIIGVWEVTALPLSVGVGPQTKAESHTSNTCTLWRIPPSTSERAW